MLDVDFWVLGVGCRLTGVDLEENQIIFFDFVGGSLGVGCWMLDEENQFRKALSQLVFNLLPENLC